MTTQHTPLPWYTETDVDILDANGMTVCSTLEPESNVATQADYDNAAFIVKACNSHAALVEALEALLNLGEYDGDGNYVIKDRGEYTETDSPDEAVIPELAQALAALKLAKES